MKHCTFISYSKEDVAVAETACRRLEDQGIKCWIAPRDILPGETYSQAIVKAIRHCPIMIFVFSSTANASRYVMRELEAAVDESMVIIPFRIEDVQPSDSIKFFIKAEQWLDAFPGPSEDHFETLASTVKQHLSGECADAQSEELKDPFAAKEAEITSKDEREFNEFEQALRSAEDLLKEKHWTASIRKCGVLLEKAMQELLNHLLDSIEKEEAKKGIMEAEKKFGTRGSSYKHFGLDQLIRMYNEANVFDELRKMLTSNLHKTKNINWDQVSEWYEISKRKGDTGIVDEGDAMQMLYWTKVLLFDCELAGEAPTVLPVPEEKRSKDECPYCEEPLKSEWNFCPECGAALKITCDACHRVLAPDFRICPYCESHVLRKGTAEPDSIQKAREEYRVLCIGSYLDGVINLRERSLLDGKRLELGLTSDEAEKIERDCAPENVVEYTRLVEGVLVDGVITEEERSFLQKKAAELKIDNWASGQIEEVVDALRKKSIGNL
jgi:hypothetical protein